MQRIKNALVMFLMACIIFANSIVGYAAEEREQEFYLLYMHDQDNGVTIEVGTRQIIMEQALGDINLDNLTLFPIEAGVYHPFQMKQMDEEEMMREIREYLLYAGYAKIDDEANAESYELVAQEHAEENCLGGWGGVADEQEEYEPQEKTDSELDENSVGKFDERFSDRLEVKRIGELPLHIQIIMGAAIIVLAAIFARKIKNIIKKRMNEKELRKRKKEIKKRHKQRLKRELERAERLFSDSMLFSEEDDEIDDLWDS